MRYAPTISPLAVIVLVVFCVPVFWLNVLGTASEHQFRTYRDGSEALVLGKVLADVQGIATGRANLGFIERDVLTRGHDVLAVYPRVDNPDSIVPANVSDENWIGGVSRHHPQLLLPRAAMAVTGYASNEVMAGDRLAFADGETRTVTAVSVEDQFLKVDLDLPIRNSQSVGYPAPARLITESNLLFDPYVSQFGVQGPFFSLIYRYVPGFHSVKALQLLVAFSFAVAVVFLARELSLSISISCGIIFFFCMIGSPWVVAKARDLYWVPVLWLLPTLVAMWIYRGVIPVSAGLVFYLITIAVKSLAGYEYLPMIVLFSMSIFIADIFLPKPRFGRLASVAMILGLGIASLAGFFAALLIHGSIRADTIWEGVRQTLIIDGLKYNQLSEIAQVASRGLEPSTMEIVSTYVLQWHTPVLFWWQQPLGLAIPFACSFLALIYQFATSMDCRWRDAAILVSMTGASLSWIVLMKGHSTIHTHLNYILWYFGAVPAMGFVIWNAFRAATIRYLPKPVMRRFLSKFA